MIAKRIKLIIGKSHIEVDLEFDEIELEDGDDDPEMMASYAMLAAYAAGEIEIEITDIDPTELPINNTLQ